MGSLVKDFFAQQQVTGTQSEPPAVPPTLPPVSPAPSPHCHALRTASDPRQGLPRDSNALLRQKAGSLQTRLLPPGAPDTRRGLCHHHRCTPGPASAVAGSRASVMVSVALETQLKRVCAVVSCRRSLQAAGRRRGLAVRAGAGSSGQSVRHHRPCWRSCKLTQHWVLSTGGSRGSGQAAGGAVALNAGTGLLPFLWPGLPWPLVCLGVQDA